MNPRSDYFAEILTDALEAVKEVHLEDTPDLGALVAALVLSDSLNALRKAFLSRFPDPRSTGRARDE